MQIYLFLINILCILPWHGDKQRRNIR